jgi:hypothetical protein
VREYFDFDGPKVEDGSVAVVQTVAACRQYCAILRTVCQAVSGGLPNGLV